MKTLTDIGWANTNWLSRHLNIQKVEKEILILTANDYQPTRSALGAKTMLESFKGYQQTGWLSSVRKAWRTETGCSSGLLGTCA